jgi:hypothetical protein
VLDRAVAAYRVNSSAVAVALLVVANLIPLAGVLWFGWDLILILALYWAENGIVGVINVLKILTAQGTGTANAPFSRLTVNGRPAANMNRGGTVGFFIVHYGLFWVSHGLFVFAFLPAMAGAQFYGPDGVPFGEPLEVPPGMPNLAILIPGVIGLAISHGVSFWENYLGRGEYRNISPAQLMTQPYGRLVVMHVTIVMGAFVSAFIGTPLGSLLVLVVLKTAMDLYFHLRQHRSGAAPAGQAIVAD